MGKYEGTNAQVRFIDQNGDVHVIGPIQDISWGLADKDTGEPVKLVKGDLPTITLTFTEMDTKTYRGLLRMFWLDWLWNGWMRMVNRVTGRN